MAASQPTPVRAFISYSWTSPTHESWVLNLATRLREDGVDVILDKWDLKPGHDAYQFMETMVTDSTVTKVLMICDKGYVEKANARSGGVGTESQIISPELYKDARQDKFAALMTDDDGDGNAHVPVFYKGRIFFDFRAEGQSEASYEQLLRWIVDKPLHVKPKLGSVPSAILTAQPVASGTQSHARRAENAIREDKAAASANVREFAEAMVGELRALAPSLSDDVPVHETILAAVDAMRPYLRQFVELVAVAARYSEDIRVWEQILTTLELLGTLTVRSPDIRQWNTQQFDANIIIAHEAFLSVVALALDEQRFDLAAQVFDRGYLIREDHGGDRASMADFTAFRQYPHSLDLRQRELNRVSLQADIIHDAHPTGSVPSFESLMQADFVAYLRAESASGIYNWYPMTLVYSTRTFRPFPIFARAESKIFLERLLPAIGVENEDALKARITAIAASQRSAQMFSYHGLPVAYLSNLNHLGTRK